MNSTYLRMLVFQPTGHVVWVHEESQPAQCLPRRIPNVGKELDYVIFNGTLKPALYNWYNDFKNYKLISHTDSQTLRVIDLPDEFVNTVRLMRAKCYVMWSIINNIEIQKEKFDLVSNPIANTDIDINKLSAIFETQLGITQQDSKKLIQFKRDEILQNLEYLNLAEIRAELILSQATTVDEVTAYFELVKTELMMTQAIILDKLL